MEYYFRAEKLTVGYNGRPVVKDIEASVKKGQIATLIGPNASGKSTILKSMAGQLKTISGVALINDTPLEAINPQRLARQMAIVSTERPQPELMTCGELVAVGRYPYTGKLGILSDEDKEKIAEALSLVKALELMDRNLTEVSDGQLQRIMLARALCQEPEIIILDEPTSFLDIRYAVEILDVLHRLATERKVTVIMSLHELNYARRVSDLVICIKNGYVMELGEPEAIFTEETISRLYDLPAGTYTELFGEL